MTTKIRVSSSEIDAYRQCRLKHQLSYMEKWRTDEEAEALSRGTLYHSVMEAHYRKIEEIRKEGNKSDDIAEDLFLAVAPLLYEEGTGAQSERQELVTWIYEGYVDNYQTDNLWEIVGVEVPLDMPLLRRDGSESDFILSGTCDLVIRDVMMDGLWIVDHKTCKDLPKKDFDLEDQTAIYTLLMRRAGWDIRGAIYNHCRTYKLKTREMGHDERFKRTITTRTDYELEECAFEALELMEEAYGRDLIDPATGQPRDAPRSPDGERCGWKCGYTEACIAGRKYGPERTRSFLDSIGFEQHDTKPGPTFNKVRAA